MSISNLLSGNLLIEGAYKHCFQLLNEVRRFSLILVEDTCLEAFDGDTFRLFRNLLGMYGDVGVLSRSEEPFKYNLHDLELYRIYKDKQGNYWHMYMGYKVQNEKINTVQVESLTDFLHQNTCPMSSVLAIDVELMDIVKSVFFLNERDGFAGSYRDIVLISNQSEGREQRFADIRKLASVYGFLFRRILIQ